MKNRNWMLGLLLAAVLMCLAAPALAAQVVVDEYSDAPANPTQENVISIEAALMLPGQEPQAIGVLTMEPTKLTVDTLTALFDFVNINQRPPVRFFPEETQAEIAQLVSVDPDILYVPEFMSVLPQRVGAQADAVVDMHMNIAYEPGRPVVVVLGCQGEEGVEWKALDADVLVADTIHFELPAQELARFGGRETLLVVMSVKPGSGWQLSQTDVTPEEYNVPSKSAADIAYVEETVTISGTGDASDCRIIIVDNTPGIDAELEKLSAWFADGEKAPADYFDEATLAEIRLMIAPAQTDALVPYEAASVMVVNYQEPFGDVMAQFIFPTPFEEGKAVVAAMGMPDEQGVFTWTPLHTEIVDGYAEITFGSAVLPAMMEKAGLLLVFSEPLDE